MTQERQEIYIWGPRDESRLFSFLPKVTSQSYTGCICCCQPSGFHLSQLGTDVILIGTEI